MLTDFTGFTFDGVHSSELNILRVSDGDRYNEELLPEIENKTVETSGKDGVYYFGSFYKSKDIEIKIAFDSVTEEQYRNIRRLFGQKKICKLIFDERPYKVYHVKLSQPITLETICFDEEEYHWSNEKIPPDYTETYGEHEGYIPGSINHKIYTGNKRRIYKGEGTINLTAFDPFARQQYKTLDLYTINGYDNVDEWKDSSGLLTAEEYAAGAYDVYQDISDTSDVKYADKFNGQFNVYNPGDIDTPYYMFIPYVDNKLQAGKGNEIIIGTDGAQDLVIEPFERMYSQINENGVLISSRAELIEGVQYDYTLKAWRITGNIYNRYIKRGKFGKIYKGDKFDFKKQGIYLNCLVGENQPAIFYNYLYF